MILRDKISLPSDEEGGREYEVMAIVENLPLYIYLGRTFVDGIKIYIPLKEFGKYTDNFSIMTAMFNVEDEYIQNVGEYIQNKIKQISTLDYRSKSTYEQEYNDMINTFTTVGYTLRFNYFYCYFDNRHANYPSRS